MTPVGRILILPKGRYDADTVYNMLDLVMHNGTSWLAKKTVVNIEPSEENVEYWQKLVDVDDAIDHGIEEFFSSGDSSLPLTIPKLTLYNLDNTNMRGTLGVDEQGALKYGDNKVYHSNNLTSDLEIYLENYLKTYLDNNLETRLKELSSISKISTDNYEGNGEPITLTFKFNPLFIVVSKSSDAFLLVYGKSEPIYMEHNTSVTSDYSILDYHVFAKTMGNIKWEGKSVTLPPVLNNTNDTYTYFAVGC